MTCVHQQKKEEKSEDLRDQAFALICQHVEDNYEDETYTIKLLCDLMSTHNCEAYSENFMKQKLKDKFGDDLVIT